MLLHETAKAGEVCCHTGDAHHSAFSCQGTDKGSLLYPVMHAEKKASPYLVTAMFTLCQAQY